MPAHNRHYTGGNGLRSGLSERLKAVYSFVRNGSVAADIGSDHGQLICALVGDGVCPRGYAVDVNEKPLNKTREAVAACRLQDRVSTLLGDGLFVLAGKPVDDIIIAGMGGELIARIICDAPWLRESAADYRLILQPMSRADFLRRRLYGEGFVLKREKIIAEHGKFYPVMLARFDGKTREVSDSFALSGLAAADPDPIAGEYLRIQAERLGKKINGMERGAAPEQDALESAKETEAALRALLEARNSRIRGPEGDTQNDNRA